MSAKGILGGRWRVGGIGTLCAVFWLVESELESQVGRRRESEEYLGNWSLVS